MNQTIERFGYPQTLIWEYEHWIVLLRPQQVTLGALILACKDPATAFSAITQEAFTELAEATRHIEGTLAKRFRYDKLNYLMLMMVDPDVHFHVIPRYGRAITFGGVSFEDPGWPKTPDLGHANEVRSEAFEALRMELIRGWEDGPH